MSMFKGKGPGREASSQTNLHRFIDLKKEPIYRANSLRKALKELDTFNKRALLEQHSVEACQLLNELLVSVSSVRSSLEPVELALEILENLLLYLPDLVSMKWQYHAIGSALKRFLTPANDYALRKRAIKLFIYFYQIMGISKYYDSIQEWDYIFPLLVPHFPGVTGRNGEDSEKLLEEACGSVDAVLGQPFPQRNMPLLPSPNQEGSSVSLQEFLENLLKAISNVTRIEWNGQKQQHQLSCFRFLFNRFRQVYIPHVFHVQTGSQSSPPSDGIGGQWIWTKSIVDNRISLPEDGRSVISGAEQPLNDPVTICRYCIIRWIVMYTLSPKALTDVFSKPVAQPGTPRVADTNGGYKLPSSYALVRGVLFENINNTDLTLTILKEGLLLPLQLGGVIQRIIVNLKEWLLFEVTPPYMENNGTDKIDGKIVDREASIVGVLDTMCWLYFNPYILHFEPGKAINTATKASGKVVQHLNSLASPQRFQTLSLSVHSWHSLLNCLLRVIRRAIPPRLEEETGFSRECATQLFPALLISWVLGAAVCRVPISTQLWDDLSQLLTARTYSLALIEEWSKVLESCTRALGTSLYRVDLNAPAERQGKNSRAAEIATRQNRSYTAAGPAATSNRGSDSGTNDVSFGLPDFCPPVAPPTISESSSSEKKDQIFTMSQSGKQQPASYESSRLSTVSNSNSNSGNGTAAGQNGIIAHPSTTQVNSNGNQGSTSGSDSGHTMTAVGSGGPAPPTSKVYGGGDSSGCGTASSIASPSEKSVTSEEEPWAYSASSITAVGAKPNPRLSNNSSSNNSNPASGETISIGGETGSIHSVEFGDRTDPEKGSLYDREDVGSFPDMSNDEKEDVSLHGDGDEEDVEFTPRLGSDGGMDQDGGATWASVWQRILGSIGDINEISHAPSRLRAIKAVGTVIGMLIKIQDQQGVSGSSGSSAGNGGSADGNQNGFAYTPPVTQFIPMLLNEASNRTVSNKETSEESMAHLCRIMVRRDAETVGEEIHAAFFHNLHAALERGDRGMIDEVVCNLSKRVFTAPNHPLLADSLSGCQQIINSHHEGAILSCATGFLATLISLPKSFPNQLAQTSATISQAKTQLIRVLGLSDTRLDAKSLNLGVNGLTLYVYLSVKQKVTSADETVQRSLKDSMTALLSCLRQRDSTTASSVLQSMSILLSTASEESYYLIEELVDLIEKRRVVDQNRIFCERGITLLTDWIIANSVGGRPFRGRLEDSEGGGTSLSRGVVELIGKVIRLISRCANDGAVMDCGRSSLFTICKFLGQYPLSGLSHSQIGYVERVHLNSSGGSDVLANSNRAVTGIGLNKKTLWCLDNSNPSHARVTLRNPSGKGVWRVRRVQQVNSSSPSLVNQWLKHRSAINQSQPVKDLKQQKTQNVQAQKPSGSSSASHSSSDSSSRADNTGSLAVFLSELSISSPEAQPMTAQSSIQCPTPLPKETEVRNAIQNLKSLRNGTSRDSDEVLTPTSADPFPTSHWANLVADLGLSDWDVARNISALSDTSGQIQRNLKHLDSLSIRQTHKIALIYVGPGQDDKLSILENEDGSIGFEAFVESLGWEVDLEKHTGYSGGLSKGTTAYYSTATSEIIYHVSTRLTMDLTKKTRHLGNDEVHIVWSENCRDYRRSVFPTEFCDVLIVIYPLPNNLFRIQISTTQDKAYVGPLLDGAVVEGGHLGELVRATAVNASERKRRETDGWIPPWENSVKILDDIINAPSGTSIYAKLLNQMLAPRKDSSSTEPLSARPSISLAAPEHQPLGPTPSGPVPSSSPAPTVASSTLRQQLKKEAAIASEEVSV